MAARYALVVDDDADGREALAQVLEAHGYTVRQAENGRIAVEMVAERIPALMLLDLDMPVMNGWEVLAWMEHDAAQGATVVVILSAAGSPPPDLPFVRKPCDVGILLDVIDASGPGPVR